MSAYAIANLRSIDIGPDIVRYLREIDATLEPYEGAFLVHGKEVAEMDGAWPGTVVVIAFPSREQADAWYASDAYQAILPLRTDNSDGAAIIVDGVEPGYRAASLVAAA